jgi:hypothetical protein
LKKIELNYAEKQTKKDVSCKDENTYFALEDKKINFSKINPKIEIPFVKLNDFNFIRNFMIISRKYIQTLFVLPKIRILSLQRRGFM